MARVVLALIGSRGRQLLDRWLSRYHSVITHHAGEPLEENADLWIVDEPSLKELGPALQSWRDREQPGLLPVLLLTPNDRRLWARAPQLWRYIDEAVHIPVSKVELQARIEILLRARRLSEDLRLRNDDLEAFIQAMSHDLRASLRAVALFAEALYESQGEKLNEEGRADLNRIRLAADEMRDLIDSLLNFSRLGRGEVRYQAIDLRDYIEACMRNLQVEIRDRNARVQIRGRSETVFADPTLLKIALTNLISNAIKFVPSDVQPEITVSTVLRRDTCRIQVNDNGVGITNEDQQRIFTPFVRLYPGEGVPGTGLGLPSARKAVELMGGRIGLESIPGRGSTFWIELPRTAA